MNNSFTQKAQHYLNESYRLTEELDAEIQYSALLEAVLEELVGTENFQEIMEVYTNVGTVKTRVIRDPGRRSVIIGERGFRLEPRPTAAEAPGRNNQENFLRRVQQLRNIASARGAFSAGLFGADDAKTAFNNAGGVIPSGIATHDAPKTLSGVYNADQNGYPVTVDPNMSVTKFSTRKARNQGRQWRVSTKTQTSLDRPQPGSKLSRGEHARQTNVRNRMLARLAAARTNAMQAARASGNVILPRDSALPISTKRFNKTD